MNKGMSNSGAIHLLLDRTGAEAACATGKVRPRLVPLTAAEGDRPVTCKRCLRIEANTRAAQVAQAGDTAAIDAALELTELDDAAIEALANAPQATPLTEGEQAQVDEMLAEAAAQADPGMAELLEQRDTEDALRAAAIVDEATASDTEAAEEAAERDTAEAQPQAEDAPAAPAPAQRARVNQRELVLAYLEAHPGEAFTPHAISKAVTPQGAKRLGLRDCLARLADKGEVELVEGTGAATYRLPALPENATA